MALRGDEEVVARLVHDHVGALDLVVDPVRHDQRREERPGSAALGGEGDGAREAVLPGDRRGDEEVLAAIRRVMERARIAKRPDPARRPLQLLGGQVHRPVRAQDLAVLAGAVQPDPPAIGEERGARLDHALHVTSGALRRGGRRPCSRRRPSRPERRTADPDHSRLPVKRRRRTRGRGRSSGRRPSQRAGCAPRRGAARGGRPRERRGSSTAPGRRRRTVGRPRPAPARGPRCRGRPALAGAPRPRSREPWWQRPRQGDRDARASTGGARLRSPATRPARRRRAACVASRRACARGSPSGSSRRRFMAYETPARSDGHAQCTEPPAPR